MKTILDLYGKKFTVKGSKTLIYTINKFSDVEALITWSNDKESVKYDITDVYKYINNGEWILLKQ